MATQDELNLAQQSQLPPDLLAAQQQLNRQQRMAEMLMSQNQQPQGQMISGRYVAPAWTQQLAPVVNQLTGSYLANKGDERATALAQQLRTGRNAAEESIINKMTGAPAQATELAGPYTGNVPMPTAVQPAVAPDLAGALREIGTNQYGAGKDLKPTILKQMMPDLASEEKLYNRAVAQGYKGNIMQFMDEQNRSKANVTNINMGQRGFDNTIKLGENFKSEPIYKTHQEISQAYQQVNNALSRNDASGDMVAAIKINKMLDPTSVVRESEAARIAASRGILDTLGQLTDKVTKGETLTPEQRKQYRSLVKDFYDISGNQYNETRNKYSEIGKVNQLSGVETMLGQPWKPPTEVKWGTAQVVK
jgi:hypothetical protein